MFDFQDEDRIITSTMKNEDIDVENDYDDIIAEYEKTLEQRAQNTIKKVNGELDGQQDSTMILRGFTRREWGLLWKDAETIRKNLPQTAILPDGTGIAVFYAGSAPVYTGDAELKSIKTNLDIKEWSVK